MNPWALILGLLAIGCIIVSVKGTQDNLLSAVLGRQYGNTSLGSATSGSGTTSTATIGGVKNLYQ